MKRRVKGLFAAVLSVIFSLASPAGARAAPEARITEWGDFAHANVTTTYSLSTGEVIIDLFGDVTKELVPGDVKTVVITFFNGTAEAVDFYLVTSEVLDETKSAIAREKYLNGKWASAGLLGRIDLVIAGASGGEPVFKGNLDAADERVHIGRVGAGGNRAYSMTIGIDRGLDNSFQDALTAVGWQFLARSVHDPLPPVPAPTSPGGGHQTPSVTAEPEETPHPSPNVTPPPVSALPEPSHTPPKTPGIPEELPGVDPPEDGVNGGDGNGDGGDYEVIVTPKTGDPGAFTWAAVCAVSLAGLVLTLLLSSRRKTRSFQE